MTHPRLDLRPCSRDVGNNFIAKFHRHSKPVRQAICWVSAWMGDRMVGVACAERPKAGGNCDGFTIEITRNCVTEGVKNACSFLYGALCRAAKPLGYLRAITYTLATESGASLRAAGFRPVAKVKGRSWTEQKKRRRLFDNGPEVADRVRWERTL